MKQQKEALRVLEEALRELESPKGSVLSAIQKLSRAAGIIGNDDVKIWCAIQLGDSNYTISLNKFLTILMKSANENTESDQQAINAVVDELNALQLNPDTHYSSEELSAKSAESGGGYKNIGFIEERYADLVRTKRGNDGTYYKTNLNDHINYVRKKAHEFASALFNQLKFSGTASNCFDLLKNAVDDRLLDLSPPLAEQLMLAFKAVSAKKDEEWSQALTTCRRLLENLADELFPPTDNTLKGRPLGQTHYINRLWAFMDASIESNSNKDLAKTHVDFLGAWIEKINKLSNKGVHAEVGQLEAVKAVFHTYLALADILEYLDNLQTSKGKPDINTVTIDELEALLDVPRKVAKEIVKARIKEGHIDLDTLSQVDGVGPKTFMKAKDIFFPE